MMAKLANPSPRQIAILFAIAGVLLLWWIWAINSGDPDTEAYSFPLILFGLTFLFIAGVQSVLRSLNQRLGPPA